MTVKACAGYSIRTDDGCEQHVRVEVSTDAGYSPDLLDDLTARARGALGETIKETWPDVADQPAPPNPKG